MPRLYGLTSCPRLRAFAQMRPTQPKHSSSNAPLTKLSPIKQIRIALPMPPPNHALSKSITRSRGERREEGVTQRTPRDHKEHEESAGAQSLLKSNFVF